MRYKALGAFVVFAAVVITGCVNPCPPIDPQIETITHLDDYLIPLAKAVEAVVDKLPPTARDDEIISEAVKRSGNPLLTKPFEGYTLKARISGDTAVLLVCSKDGREGIIEDVTCTTRPDSFRPSDSPCAFFLDAKSVCDHY